MTKIFLCPPPSGVALDIYCLLIVVMSSNTGIGLLFRYSLDALAEQLKIARPHILRTIKQLYKLNESLRTGIKKHKNIIVTLITLLILFLFPEHSDDITSVLLEIVIKKIFE